MRPKSYVAVLLVLFSAAAAWGQATPASPGLQGTGPRVEVQQSANGTLDVSGSGAINLQGENFRGSFGASRTQPPAATVAPRPLGGSSFATPLSSPDFNPSLPGGAIQSPDESGVNAYRDLVLPRFRSGLTTGARQATATRSSVEDWRYRYSGGRWWYWQPSESWLYWDGARWLPFAARQ